MLHLNLELSPVAISEVSMALPFDPWTISEELLSNAHWLSFSKPDKVPIPSFVCLAHTRVNKA